jgi:hypothetical protein
MKRIFEIKDAKSKFYAVTAVEALPLDAHMQVTIEPVQKKRSNGQNRKLWASVIGDFVKQGRMDGLNFNAETWHFFLKKEFLPDDGEPGITLDNYVKWIELPDGSLMLTGSTTQLTTKGAAEYIEKCYAFGADELGIKFTISRKEAEGLEWMKR